MFCSTYLLNFMIKGAGGGGWVILGSYSKANCFIFTVLNNRFFKKLVTDPKNVARNFNLKVYFLCFRNCSSMNRINTF